MNHAFAIRGVLEKEGFRRIKLELVRTGDYDFAMFVNGKNEGVFWTALTPPQAGPMRHQPLDLNDAFARCVAKNYPDYTVSNLEEGS